MQTLYIDVYFLINFTVDVISIYFAAIFSKVPTTPKRMIFGGVIGAFFATFVLFLPEIPLLKLFASGACLFFIGYISSKGISLRRKIKFIFAFLIFEALLGGVVSFLWEFFDKYLYKLLSGTEGGAANRKMLIFSIIVLLSIGVFKMLVSFFSNIESEGSEEIEITFLEKSVRTEAFVDSGNLAIDPMDMRPVLFLKVDIAKELLPSSVLNLHDPDALPKEVRKRIRLIPVSKGGATHVLTGVRADKVSVITGDKSEEICVTLAIDKEGGTFGGYSALLPSAAISDAHK